MLSEECLSDRLEGEGEEESILLKSWVANSKEPRVLIKVNPGTLASHSQHHLWHHSSDVKMARWRHMAALPICKSSALIRPSSSSSPVSDSYISVIISVYLEEDFYLP